MGCLDPPGLPAARARQVNLSLQIAQARTGRPGEQDQRDLPDAGSLRLPARPRTAAPRGLVNQPEENAKDLPRVRPAITQQDTKATRESQVARRTKAIDAVKRYMGDGLRT